MNQCDGCIANLELIGELHYKGDKIVMGCEKDRYMNTKTTSEEKIKEIIQSDLDNGKFVSICSNETTFKEYVFGKLKQVRQQTLEEAIDHIFNHTKTNGKLMWIKTEDVLSSLQALKDKNK